MSDITVRKVESKHDFDVFLRFPWMLYKDNPYWVPQLVSMERHKLDREHSATWEYMTGEYFIAWRGDQPVGTIAAFINHRHNKYWDENIGFFGYFETIDDLAVVQALFAAAEDYVKSQGAEAIRGPMTFTINDHCGLLIENFDDPPTVLSPYNPEYYKTLVEQLPGYEKVMDTYAYYITLQGAAESERLQKVFRVINKNNERRGIVVRSVNVKDLKGDLTLLKEIFNSAWEKNWGFVPFSDAELDDLIKDLGQFLDPNVTLFAEVNGKPAGFLLAVPDLHQALQRAYPRPGKPEFISLLQVLWHWKIRSKITRLRIPLMGVKEQYRGIGVEAAMFADLFERGGDYVAKNNIVYADGGWVLETNTAMAKLVDQHNGYVYKKFRFYQRDFAPTPAATGSADD